jgi:hypothetical protein
MSRNHVTHAARPDGRSCECGARFPTPAKLRKHLRSEHGDERVERLLAGWAVVCGDAESLGWVLDRLQGLETRPPETPGRGPTLGWRRRLLRRAKVEA